jgi:DNA polymerase I
MVPPLSTIEQAGCMRVNAICDDCRRVAPTSERPLLIIDGDNLAHRAYHSMPKSLKAPDGRRPINAIVGWTNMLVTLWDSQQPRSMFVAWDTLGVDTYRHKLWPNYQGGRVFDDAIVRQLDLLPSLAAAFGFGVGKKAGYEADDFMAAAAEAETRRGGHSLLLTTDRDAYQLVSDSVTVLAPRSGVRDLVRIGPSQVVERMGVLPEQIPDYKALAGDASDKIPGAKGIGPKAAAGLLLKYGTLEAVLEARLSTIPPATAEQLRIFKQIVLMQTDGLAVELPASGPPNWRAAAARLRELGAENSAERIEARAKPGSDADGAA